MDTSRSAAPLALAYADIDRLEPVLRLSRKPAAIKCYMWLWLHECRGRPGYVNTTLDQLGARHGVTRGAVKDWIPQLEELGLIDVIERKDGLKLYVYEPEVIDGRPRKIEPDPQQTLPGVELEEEDAPPLANPATESLVSTLVFRPSPGPSLRDAEGDDQAPSSPEGRGVCERKPHGGDCGGNPHQNSPLTLNPWSEDLSKPLTFQPFTVPVKGRGALEGAGRGDCRSKPHEANPTEADPLAIGGVLGSLLGAVDPVDRQAELEARATQIERLVNCPRMVWACCVDYAQAVLFDGFPWGELQRLIADLNKLERSGALKSPRSAYVNAAMRRKLKRWRGA
jgi:hypothetical protein